MIKESTLLSFDHIKKLYPNEWVLIGNPQLNDDFVGSVVSKLLGGVVLFHSKDRREIGYKAKDVRQGYESVVCVYTGEMPKNRKYWL